MTPAATRRTTSGAWLLRIGRRYCSPQVFDSLVLPIVADLQHQQSATSHSRLSRAAASERACVSLLKALLVYHATDETPTPVNPFLAGARWVLALPVALLVALAVQFLGVRYAGIPLYLGFGPQEWITWATKCLTTPFMASSFLIVVYWCAPIHKRAAAATALGIVLAWGCVLSAGAFSHRGIHGWLFALGLSSIAGGVVTSMILWRVSQEMGRSGNPQQTKEGA
jgi:hypothetical protein